MEKTETKFVQENDNKKMRWVIFWHDVCKNTEPFFLLVSIKLKDWRKYVKIKKRIGLRVERWGTK